LQEWQVFRRALPREYHNQFDRLFAIANQSAQAGSALSNPFPMEVVLVSAVLELLKENENLKERFQQLKKDHESLAHRFLEHRQ
jgi:hypothetical protein